MARSHLTERETIRKLGTNLDAGQRLVTKLAEHDTALDAVGAFILPDVANAFDPTVTGLTGRIGATVGTIDHAKAWIKTGASNTAWTAVHST